MPCSITPAYEKPEDIYLSFPPEKRGGKFAESRLYALLKEQLPENWFVIYSLFFQGELRSNEMDFLVLVPGKGMVYLECKGKGYTVKDGGKNFICEKNPQQNFSLQDRHGVIKGFAHNIRENFFPNELYTPFFGYAVLFPTVNIVENGSSAEESPEQPFDFHGLHVYMKDDLVKKSENISPLQEIIEKILSQAQNARSTFFQENEARKIFEYYSSSARTTEEICDIKSDDFNRGIDHIFEGSADQPCNYILNKGSYKYIQGAAGTGKTWIAIESAKRFVAQYKREHPDKGCRVIYVCYNTLLAAEIEIRNQEFKELSVANFHRLEQVCLNKQGGDFHKNKKQYDEQQRDQEIHDSLAQAIANKELKKYDLILIDEAQDFNRLKIETLCMLAKSQGRKMVFFADTEQNVHPSKEAEPIFSAVGSIEPFPALKKVIRNSGNIQNYAAKLIDDKETFPIKDDGPEVSSISNATFENIKDTLQSLNDVPSSRIAILWDGMQFKDQDDEIRSTLKKSVDNHRTFLGQKKSYGETKKDLKAWHSSDDRYLWATSLQKFKGLEASYVLLLLKGTMTLPTSHYVGATRAKYKLFVFQMK